MIRHFNLRQSVRAEMVGIGVLGVVCVLSAAWYAGFGVVAPRQNTHNQSAAAESSSPATDVVLGWSRTPPDGSTTYRSERYHFELFHPKALSVQEFDEGGGAQTITFQDLAGGQGFQIFIVPYGESQVSQDRFKRDIPSGIRTDMTNITIDGATGAAFYSKDALLGDTREVWFIHDGHLFEVTAPKSLDHWLGEIMLTWRFV